MANNKEIVRDQYIRIRMSKEEKALWLKYAEEMNIPPARFARNIIILEAESKINKIFGKNVIKAYRYYLKVTNQKNKLEELNKET